MRPFGLWGIPQSWPSFLIVWTFCVLPAPGCFGASAVSLRPPFWISTEVLASELLSSRQSIVQGMLQLGQLSVGYSWTKEFLDVILFWKQSLTRLHANVEERERDTHRDFVLHIPFLLISFWHIGYGFPFEHHHLTHLHAKIVERETHRGSVLHIPLFIWQLSLSFSFTSMYTPCIQI